MSTKQALDLAIKERNSELEIKKTNAQRRLAEAWEKVIHKSYYIVWPIVIAFLTWVIKAR